MAVSFESVGVIGAGAWGTALANAAARAGRDVVLYARDQDAVAEMQRARMNPRLPGVALEMNLAITGDLKRAVDADVLMLVVPAQQVRGMSKLLAPLINNAKPVVICAKGIEQGSRKFMTEVLREESPRAIPAILSGPSFAADVARGLPTAVTLAADDETLATSLVHALGSPTFRPYHSTDVRGVEIGGAAKNVLAIAAGIVQGRKLGASALAALTTRGFAELMRFGVACGAKAETIAGLSGLGDLLLTCSSPQSRNFSLGVALGCGETPDRSKLSEGELTAPALIDLAHKMNIEMPVASAVNDVLAGRANIDDAIGALLSRPFKAEG